MRFHIGPWVYFVVISEGPLKDENGIDCAGLCSWLDSTIYISGRIPLERRADVLLHELRHAWNHHFGKPESIEEDANATASFTMMCIKEFVSQGGEKALMAMTAATPAAIVPSVITPSGSSDTWAQSSPDGGTECGWCGRRFSAGEIVTEEPVFHAQSGKLVVPRSVYCDGCSHVLRWHEASMFDSTPSGQIVGKLSRLRGADATVWLRQFGEQAGVMVA